MWSGGKDVTNEAGESILLLEPKTNSTTTTKKEQKQNPSSSFLGGNPIYYPNQSNSSSNDISLDYNNNNSNSNSNPKCDNCDDQMYLLLQMYAPINEMERTMYVFGCNKAPCIQQTFIDNNNKFSLGGKGVIKCIRSQCKSIEESKVQNDDIDDDDIDDDDNEEIEEIESNNHIEKNSENKTKKLSSWGDTDDGGWGDTDDGGWGDSGMSDNDASGGGWGDDIDIGTGAGVDADTNIKAKNSNDENNSMDDLEAMLTAMEAKDEEKDNDEERGTTTTSTHTNTKSKKKKKKKQKHNTKKQVTDHINSSNNESDIPSFQMHELDVYDEPMRSTHSNMNKLNDPNIGNDDDDDDLIGITNKDDSIVQKMLSSYLKEEDDDDVKAAIGKWSKGGLIGNSSTSGGGGKGGNGNGEKYERLPPEDRAFLTFTDRIKRAPFQSVRYAYDGIPIWSIPTPLTPIGRKGGRSRDTNFPMVPPCVCGAKRKFEFQLMPSILHLLDVDMYSSVTTNDSTTNVNSMDLERVLSKNEGGMNWGAIAVYSCSDSCSQSTEEYVIIQESVDANPQKMRVDDNGDNNNEDSDNDE